MSINFLFEILVRVFVFDFRNMVGCDLFLGILMYVFMCVFVVFVLAIYVKYLMLIGDVFVIISILWYVRFKRCCEGLLLNLLFVILVLYVFINSIEIIYG